MTEEEKVDLKIKTETQLEGKYLTFSLGNEEYGVSILKVREIIGIIDITEMPQLPDYAKGVINLRGKVSPVIDLRMKFSMEQAEYTERTCIVLVRIDKGGSTTRMGMIVDSVSEVMQFNAEDIEDSPDIGGVNTDFIFGLAKRNGKVILLLDIDLVMNSDNLATVDDAA